MARRTFPPPFFRPIRRDGLVDSSVFFCFILLLPLSETRKINIAGRWNDLSGGELRGQTKATCRLLNFDCSWNKCAVVYLCVNLPGRTGGSSSWFFLHNFWTQCTVNSSRLTGLLCTIGLIWLQILCSNTFEFVMMKDEVRQNPFETHTQPDPRIKPNRYRPEGFIFIFSYLTGTHFFFFSSLFIHLFWSFVFWQMRTFRWSQPTHPKGYIPCWESKTTPAGVMGSCCWDVFFLYFFLLSSFWHWTVTSNGLMPFFFLQFGMVIT